MFHWHYMFSFWIYICFILYFNKLIPFNPKPLFLINIIRDLCLILHFGFNSNDKITNTILLRCFLIISIHYFPLIYLLKEDTSLFDLNSICFYGLLFFVYLLYIRFQNRNITEIYSMKINKESIQNYIRLRFNSNYEFYGCILFFIYMNLKLV